MYLSAQLLLKAPHSIKWDFLKNTGFEFIIGSVSPLFWLLFFSDGADDPEQHHATANGSEKAHDVTAQSNAEIIHDRGRQQGATDAHQGGENKAKPSAFGHHRALRQHLKNVVAINREGDLMR